jgi:hypothetical protein
VCNGNVEKENERLLCAEKNEKLIVKKAEFLYSRRTQKVSATFLKENVA